MDRICSLARDVCISRVKDKEIEVVTYSFINSDGASRFIENKVYSFSFSRDDNLAVLGISNLGCFQTGLKKIVVLVSIGNNEICALAGAEDPGISKLELLSEWKVKRESILCDALSMTDGPTLFSIEDRTAKLIVLVSQTATLIDLNRHVKDTTSVTELLQFTYVETFRVGTKAIVYLIALSVTNGNSEKGLCIFSILYDEEKDIFDDETYDIPIELFFPRSYQGMISSTCISFSPALYDADVAKHDYCHLSNDQWKQNLSIVCTKMKQCLVFREGNLKYFCSISAPDVSLIKILDPWLPIEKWVIFLRSPSKGYFQLRVKSDEGLSFLECVEQRDDASLFLVDDFCRSGTKQVLLFFEPIFDKFSEDFVMIPILPPGYNVTPDIATNKFEYSRMALNKLQETLQESICSLQEVQYSVAQNSESICRIMNQLANIRTSGSKEYQTKNNEQLNNIVHGKVSKKKLISRDYAGMKEKALQVVDGWKLFKKSDLVFGWTLENYSKNFVFKIDGFLVVDWMRSEYRVTVFIHDGDHFGLKPSGRHYLNPGERVSITFYVSMPVLIKNEYDLSCVISWHVGKTIEATNELHLNMKSLLYQQLHISSSIASDDALRGMHTKLTDLQELLSFRATQELQLLYISAKHSNLTSFEEKLLNLSPPYLPKFVYNKNVKWMIFSDASCPFHGVNLVIDYPSSEVIEVYSYFRDETEAVLFVRWLYDILPSDVSIQPVECSIKERCDLRKHMVKAMENELAVLHELIDPSATQEGKEALSTDKGICMGRRMYYKKREALTKCELVTDNLACKIFNLGRR